MAGPFITWMGTEGDDTFDYNGSGLMLVGRAGNDTYVLHDGNTYFLVEQPGEGIDTVKADFSYTLDANIENLILTGFADFSGTGNALANRIEGNSGNNVLDGGAGNDTLIGGDGDDTYYVDSASDVIVELPGTTMPGPPPNDIVIASVSYTLSANIETLQFAGTIGGVTGIGNASANTITGTTFNDVLSGAGGNDTLNGGEGNDALNGGDGDDVLNGGLGNDTLNGDGGNDVLNDDAGNDVLNGGAGNDTFYDNDLGNDVYAGGAGDDTYYAWGKLNTVVEAAGGGIDTVNLGSGSYTLPANVENLFLGFEASSGTGNALNNTLRGNDGNDTLIGLGGNDLLDGQYGADRMEGGTGNDTYLVENPGDVVVEAAGAGTDRVYVSIDGYVLTANVEELYFKLGGNANLAYGNDLANLIVGDGNADTLYGWGGNDRLDGGAGADVLVGGAGDDTYVLDTSQDLVLELYGSGTDQLLLTGDSQNYALSANVENATAVVTGLWEGIGITGNALANVLTGSNGADRIDGGSGTDRMAGLQGNDTYIVDGAGDVVVEAAGQGIDEIRSSVTIAALAANVENLTLLAAGGAIDGTGNLLDNMITGNNGNNTLVGGAGNDQLFGNAGTDHLVGSAGNDILDGGAGIDDMTGGLGDDLYYVDQLGEAVNELAGQGTDEIRTRVSLDISIGIGFQNVENLRLDGNATNGTGNALDNVITGNALNNALAGNGGNDTLLGGAGNDVLDGGAGNDMLDGGTGNDSMIGGAGNDTYVVDSLDTVDESTGSGIDTVLAAVTSYTLGTGVENGTLTYANTGDFEGGNFLTGNQLANVLIGAAGNDIISGGDGNDTLRGGAGNDTLNGETGNDRMEGGTGDDTYVVYEGDGAGPILAEDVVVENPGEGIDKVLFRSAAGTYVLPANIENFDGGEAAGGVLNLVTGNGLDNQMSGSGLANTLDGGAGNDTLWGRAGDDILKGGAGNDFLDGGSGNDTNDIAFMAGNDRMEGGAGDDSYYVDSGNGGTQDANEDRVIELAGAGTDTVNLRVPGDYVMPDNVENAQVWTHLGNFTLTGNGLDNVLRDLSQPTSGIVSFDGGAGNDVMEFAFEDKAGGSMTGGLGVDRGVVEVGGNGFLELSGVERLDVQAHGGSLLLQQTDTDLTEIDVTNEGLAYGIGISGLPEGVPVHLNDFTGGFQFAAEPFDDPIAPFPKLSLVLSNAQFQLQSTSYVEFDIESRGNVDNSVDMSGVGGALQYNIQATTDLVVSGLADTVGSFNFRYSDANVTMQAATPGSAQNWYVSLTDSQLPTLTIDAGGGADVLHIQSLYGNDAFIGELTFDGSLLLFGDGNLVVHGVESAAVTITGGGARTLSGVATGMTIDATSNDVNTLHLTGSSASDTFNFGDHLDSSDSVDGGDGGDVLNANISGLGLPGAPAWLDIHGVETLNLSLTGGAAAILDAGGIESANAVNISGGTLGSVLTVIGARGPATWSASGSDASFNFEADPATNGSFTLIGGNNTDNLTGAGGDDVLDGGKLHDYLTGGAGADEFRFDSPDLVGGDPQNDVIFDFQVGVDKIVLDNAVFTQLAGGALQSANFVADANITDTSGTDGNDFIKFDTVSGALYYDTNGNAAGGMSQFAVVHSDGVPAALSAADFDVFGPA